jgi:hypothetical protein
LRDEFERALAEARLSDVEVRETYRVREHATSAVVGVYRAQKGSV